MASPSTAATRPLSSDLPAPLTSGLAARLKLEGKAGGDEPSNCWDSLFELQACSGEVIMFFMNGETYLGHGCCQAIRVIGHDCWPNMMESLGFTSEEEDVLQGFCDDETAHHDSPPSLYNHPKVHVVP